MTLRQHIWRKVLIVSAICLILITLTAVPTQSAQHDSTVPVSNQVVTATTSTLHQTQNNQQSLHAIWDEVQSRGSYRFTVDITQTNIPAAIPSNIGRTSDTDRYYLEGYTNPPAGEMDLSLWLNGGSVALESDALEMRVRGDQAEARHGTSDWEPVSNFTQMFAPDNDTLAFLVAAENIEGPTTLERQIPSVEGFQTVSVTAYSFDINGRKFAAHIREQMEKDMRASGQLRTGQQLELPFAYLHMTGSGEILVNAEGLPISQEIRLEFPEMEGERTVADFTVHFSDFGDTVQADVSSTRSLSEITTAVTPATAQNSLLGLFTLVIISGVLLLLLLHSHSRHVYAGVVLLVVVSMVATPLLQVGTAYAASRTSEDDVAQEIATRAEEAQAQQNQLQTYKQQQANKAVAIMHQDRLGQIRSDATGVVTGSPQDIAGQPDNGRLDFYNIAALTFATSNPDGDDDGDGLTNYEEGVLGTSSSIADNDEDGIFDGVDTDADLIPDLLEVTGVTTPNGDFYLNPDEVDTNHDGLADGLECSDNNGTLDCPDTDGDGIPDAFSLDNDGDGVSDKLDLSPNGILDTVFDGATPLELQLSGSEAGSISYVEFQIRPTDPNHLWYAFNALDWPKDTSGQIEDADGVTFDNDPTGDMRLIPMLELVFSAADLPHLPDENLLANYGISLRPLDSDANDYVAYIPLQLVSDEDRGDDKVAFYGKMLYAPTSANWSAAHSYNFVWMVQFLSDQCSEFNNSGTCKTYSAYNDSQVVNVYDEEWQLTGLNFREDQGVDMAIVYEDPTIDEDIHSDVPLMALTYGLEQAYLNPRDCDAVTSGGECISDGNIDIDLDEIYNRFNDPTNGNVSQIKSWGLDDNFRVERFSYDHIDEMLINTTVTTTNNILDQHFTPVWQVDDPVAPTLFFIREEIFKSANLDGLAGTTAVSTTNANQRLQLDLAATDAPHAMKVTSFNWAPYQYNDDIQRWESYDVATYLADVLTPRLETESNLPEYTDLENEGIEYMSLLYYFVLNQGISSAVSVEFEGTDPDALIDGFSTDEHIAINIVLNLLVVNTIKHFTTGLHFTKTGNKDIFQFMGKAKTADSVNIANRQSAGRNVVKDIDELQYSMFDDIKHLKTIMRTGTKLQRVAATGSIAVVIVGVIGLGLFIAGDATNNPELAIAGGIMMAAFLLVYLIVQPVVTTVRAVNALSQTGSNISKGAATLSVLGSRSNLIGATKIGGAIGLALVVAVVWGVFIYQVQSGGYEPGSFAFNTLLAAAIAATIVAILLFIISTSVVGAIIVGILSFIDLLLIIICEANDTDDCFTISGEITNWLAGLIYQYDTLIDLDRDDMIQVGEFETLFSQPNLGLVEGNALTMRLPVDMLVFNKATEDTGAIKNSFYDASTIKETAFIFSLTEDPEKIGTSKNAMKNEWDVSTYGTATYKITHGTIPPWTETKKITLRQAEASRTVESDPIPLSPGMNVRYTFYFNTGVAIPAYECWVDSCSSETIKQKIEGEDPLGPFIYDIFPEDVETFYEFAWLQHAGQQDHDGDDVISSKFGGADPNDGVSGCPSGMCFDTDGDGLPDKFEIDTTAVNADIDGRTFDAENVDTDNDGLDDLREMRYGSNPAAADTDGDGLLDVEEVEGWLFTYAPGKQILVTSSPGLSDTDGDGLSDAAEKNLHEIDPIAFPYHPAVFNENPIGFSGKLTDDGIYAPGTSFTYTATVKNSLTNNIYADGTLDMLYPAPILGNLGQAETFSVPAEGRVQFATVKSVSPLVGSQIVAIENDILATLFQSQQDGGDELGDSELSASVRLIVDDDPPNSAMTSVPYVVPGGVRIIGGTATDPTSYVDMVEVRIAGGEWQTANGAENWAYAWDVPDAPGTYNVEIRATDVVGNQSPTPTVVQVEVDSEPPVAREAPAFDNNAYISATRNVDGLWEIDLNGTVTDNASGVRQLDMLVEPNGSGWLTTNYDESTDAWSVNYALSTFQSNDPWAVDASGQYTVSLRATDLALNDGNTAVYTFPLRIDTTPPDIALDSLDTFSQTGDQIELTVAPITRTEILSGTVTDPGDFAVGVSEVEIAFTPYDVVQSLGDQVLWIPFDEGTDATTFQDKSTTDHNGLCLLNQCPQSGLNGRFGTAIQLTNTPVEQEDYVEVLNLDVSETAYSSVIWFQTSCDDCGLLSLDEKAGLNADHDRDIFLSGGNVCSEVMGAASPICSADINYADNQWHMAAQTIGPNGGHLLYVDGELAASGPETSSPNTVQDSINIGFAPSAVTPYLNGLIDEVRVFNQELEAATVRGLFQSWIAFAPVTPGAISSEWQYQVPDGLEGLYQIDLTASDEFDNRNDQRLTWNNWRGEIDTKIPELDISVEYAGTRATAETIISGVITDDNLSIDGYDFPCALQSQDYHYDENGQLVKLTPSCSLTGWQTQVITLRGCDIYGHCAAITPDLYHIYWTYGDGLFRAPLSGAATTQADVQKLLISDNDPQGLVLDVAGGKVYWAEGGLTDTTGAIKRANLDGSEMETIITGIPSLDQSSGHWRPDKRIGLALDLGANQMYWSDTVNQQIWRANLDGSAATPIITTEPGVLSWVQVDPINGNIYWLRGRRGATFPLQDSPWPQEVWMADLNDPQNTAVSIYIDGRFIDGLEVVPVANKIYWTETIESEEGVIMQADLDGSNRTVLHTGSNETETNFGAITFESASDTLYWRTGYVHYEETPDFYVATYPHFRQIEPDGSDNQRVYPSKLNDNSTNCGSFCSFASLSIEVDGNDLEIERIPGTIYRSADLTLDILGDSDLAFRNGQNSFTISVRNLGPLDALDVQVDLALDNDYTLNQMNGCQSVSGSTCYLGTLLSDESVTFTAVLDISSSAIDTLDVTAVVSATTPDHLPANNTATYTSYYAPVRGIPPIGSEKQIYVATELEDGTHVIHQVRGEQVTNFGQMTIIIPDAGVVTGLALDGTRQKLYWLDRNTDSIWSANLDGSSAAELYTGLSEPSDLHISLDENWLYWADNATSSDGIRGRIGRDNLNTGVREVLAENLNIRPTDMILDQIRERLYWRNGSVIFSYDVQLGNEPTPITSINSQVNSIAIDPYSSRLYWAYNNYYGAINWVNLFDQSTGRRLETRTPSEVHYDLLDDTLYYFYYNGCTLYNQTLVSVPSQSGAKSTLTSCRDWMPRHVAVLHLVPPPELPVITTTPETAVIVDNEYSYQPQATGSQPITWSLVQDPGGVTFDPATGALSFTPATAGDYDFILRAANVAGSTDQPFTVTVENPPPPTISSTPLKIGEAGQPYSYQAQALGQGPITWSLISGPAGLSLDANGLVTWPNPVVGVHTVDIQASNLGGSTNQSYELHIYAFNAEGQLYWIVSGELLQRTDPNVEGNVFSLNNMPTHTFPQLTIDNANQKLYWTAEEFEVPVNPDNRIMRSDLDGTNLETVVGSSERTYGIAIDTIRDHIYWSNPDANTLLRADLNGTNVITAVTNLNAPHALEIDLINERIYYVDNGDETAAGSLFSIDFDGSNPFTLLTNRQGLVDFDIQPSTGAIYWLEEDGMGNPTIHQGFLSLGGQSITSESQWVNGSAQAIGRIGGLVANPATNDLYFTGYDTQEIWQRGNSPTNANLIADSGDGVNVIPTDIMAVYPALYDYPKPEIKILEPTSGTTATTSVPITFTAVITAYASLEDLSFVRINGPGLFPEIIDSQSWIEGEAITVTWQSTWMTDTLDTFEFELRAWDHGVGFASETITITTEPPPSDFVIPPGYTGPVIGEILSPPNGSVFNTLDPITFTGHAGSAAYLQSFTVRDYDDNFYGDGWGNGQVVTATWETAWSNFRAPDPNGAYTFTYSMLDYDGNSKTITHTIYIDIPPDTTDPPPGYTPPSAGMRIDAPVDGDILTTLDPVTISGQASSKDFINTFNVNTTGFNDDFGGFADGLFTERSWQTTWTPTADGVYVINAAVLDHAGVATEARSITVTVASTPPTIEINPTTLTGVQQLSPLLVELGGPVNGFGLTKVEVSIDGSDWILAELDGTNWRFAWPMSADNVSFTIVARVTDAIGRTGNDTETVIVDVEPPAAVDIALYNYVGGVDLPLSEGDTIHQPSAELVMTWPASSDGSGVAQYLAGWTTVSTPTQSALTVYNNTTFRHAQTVPDYASYYAHLVIEDTYGNTITQTSGPIYVDSPLTPNLISDMDYRGWQGSPSAQIGADRELNRQVDTSAAVSDIQRMYFTWDDTAMRLAWTGANWNNNGDLFVYFDTTAGGTIDLFNPYASGQTIMQPLDEGDQLEADYVLMVEDDQTIELYRWAGTDWVFEQTISADHYRFDTNYVDVQLPFTQIGAAQGGTLKMVALASAEETLQIWAAMPDQNPLNAIPVVAPLAQNRVLDSFQLTQLQSWPALSDNIYPNLNRFADQGLRVNISADSGGSTAGFLADDFLDLLTPTSRLDSNLDGDIDIDLPIALEAPPLGDGDTVAYTISYLNDGTETAEDVLVTAVTYGGLQFGGLSTVQVDLGDIPANISGTVTLEGTINAGLDGQSAEVVFVLSDNIHGDFEWIWYQHDIDSVAPIDLERQFPAKYVRQGQQSISGLVNDNYAVDFLEVQIRQQPAGTLISLNCPDGNNDGLWNCDWDAGTLENVDTVEMRVRAVDPAGNDSGFTNWESLIVDLVPPQIALDQSTLDALSDGLIGPSELLFSGSANDDYEVAEAELCTLTEGVIGSRCTTLAVTPRNVMTTTWRYDGTDILSGDNVTQTMMLFAFDGAGNRSEAVEYVYRIDTEGPLIEVTDADLFLANNGNETALAGTVFDGSGVAQITVRIRYPDGQIRWVPLSLDDNGRWQFVPQLPVPGAYQLIVEATDSVGNTTTSDLFTLTIVNGVHKVYLPVISNNAVNAPDLEIESITITSANDVRIVIKNTGKTAVRNSFWVDLYIDPNPPPIKVNDIWQNLSTEGIAWGVTDLSALVPGGSMILDLNSTSLSTEYTNFTGFRSGMNVYVQVDSANNIPNNETGAVLEDHEITGDTYNNIDEMVVPLNQLTTKPFIPLQNNSVTLSETPFLPLR